MGLATRDYAHPWLAATPDGWVSDPSASPSRGLVEFKNPHSYRDLAVNDAGFSKKCECLTINSGSLVNQTLFLRPA